jgi:hypothetical protein
LRGRAFAFERASTEFHEWLANIYVTCMLSVWSSRHRRFGHPFMGLPFVGLLDPSKLKLLRSENNAEEKNHLMMYVLCRSPWYQEYKSSLDEARKESRLPGRAGVAYPVYPVQRMDVVEGLVDDLLRASVDPKHAR